MVSPLRRAGRWGKRLWLRGRLTIAPLRGKKGRNIALNRREFFHRRTTLRSLPIHVQVGTNLTCNLHCIFCRREVPSERQRLAQLSPAQREISPRVVEELIRLLPYVGLMNLTPLGEPLLYSGLERFLDANQRIGSQNLALTTNGILLADFAERLVRGALAHLFISLDTSDPEVYRSMRVGGELEAVEEGIERVNECKIRLDTSLPALCLASTFMRRNIEQLPALVRFAHKHKVPEISVQLMEMENKSLEPESLAHHIELTRRILREAEDEAAHLGVRLIIHAALKNLLTAAEKEHKDDKTPPLPEYLSTKGKTLIEKCTYPWNFLLVDTDGDVRPCCWVSVSFGNLNDAPLRALWNNETARHMRRMFLQNIIPEYCRGKYCRVDI